MSNIKTYRVTAHDFDHAEVTLAVDLDILTPELAASINSFWSGSVYRLEEERYDVVRTVVRLFGSVAITHFLGDGGADIVTHTEAESESWTQMVIDAQGEGWPSLKELGIRIKAVMITVAGYEEMHLEALA